MTVMTSHHLDIKPNLLVHFIHYIRLANTSRKKLNHITHQFKKLNTFFLNNQHFSVLFIHTKMLPAASDASYLTVSYINPPTPRSSESDVELFFPQGHEDSHLGKELVI